MSSFENVTGFTDAFNVANNLVGGWIALGFPLVVWVAIFGFNLDKGRGQAITGASFITLLVLMLENQLLVVPYFALVADGVLLALGLVMIFMERNQ